MCILFKWTKCAHVDESLWSLHNIIKMKSFKKSITQQKHVLWHIKSDFQYSIFSTFISIFFQMFSYYITNIKRKIHHKFQNQFDLAIQTMNFFQTLINFQQKKNFKKYLN
jgi:hypothetical protein